MKFYSIFHQFNKFLSLKLRNFTVKLTINYEKKYLSSSMTIKQFKFILRLFFIAITMLSLMNN